MFERMIYKQIDSLMENKFSPYLCHFRKNHNAQYPISKMIENWKKQLDNDEKVGVIFIDFSKAFDTINHGLPLAKLKTLWFSDQALSSLLSYLCNRFQRIIINGFFSSWNEVNTEVPQGSILGLLEWYYINYIWRWKNKQNIKNDPEMDFMILHKRFHKNNMVLNPGTCHYILTSDNDSSLKKILNNNEIASSNEKNLLGILLDSKLNLILILHLFVKKQAKT